MRTDLTVPTCPLGLLGRVTVFNAFWYLKEFIYWKILLLERTVAAL